mmetsp:Transcript_8228/g.17480  ORF Transcript_8228/g.17480 Transcript_8228/m.17480 type:complete len:252 (+) Transcript_8228:1257-2012(+)
MGREVMSDLAPQSEPLWSLWSNTKRSITVFTCKASSTRPTPMGLPPLSPRSRILNLGNCTCASSRTPVRSAKACGLVDAELESCMARRAAACASWYFTDALRPSAEWFQAAQSTADSADSGRTPNLLANATSPSSPMRLSVRFSSSKLQRCKASAIATAPLGPKSLLARSKVVRVVLALRPRARPAPPSHPKQAPLSEIFASTTLARSIASKGPALFRARRFRMLPALEERSRYVTERLRINASKTAFAPM